MKKVSGSLKLDLAQYRELAAFAQFGSDLDAVTKKQLARGERLVELMKQAQYSPMTISEQVTAIYAGTKGYLDEIRTDAVVDFERDLLEFLHSTQSGLMGKIDSTKTLDEDSEKELSDAIKAFVDTHAGAYKIDAHAAAKDDVEDTEKNG